MAKEVVKEPNWKGNSSLKQKWQLSEEEKRVLTKEEQSQYDKKVEEYNTKIGKITVIGQGLVGVPCTVAFVTLALLFLNPSPILKKPELAWTTKRSMGTGCIVFFVGLMVITAIILLSGCLIAGAASTIMDSPKKWKKQIIAQRAQERKGSKDLEKDPGPNNIPNKEETLARS